MADRVDTKFSPPILPLARYLLRFRGVSGAGPLASLQGKYLGSAWRGIFGTALRDMVCVTNQPVCDDCPLLCSCPYPFIFESRPPVGSEKLTRYPRTPGPYVLKPVVTDNAKSSESILLSLTLFGSANKQFPYIAHALQKAGKNGIAKQKIELELTDIEAETQAQPSGELERSIIHGHTVSKWSSVYTHGRELRPAAATVPMPVGVRNSVRVSLNTPLRLRLNDKPILGDELEFKDFMSSLIRRISMLTYFFSPTPLETGFAELARLAEGIEISARNLNWYELKRYSSRQRNSIPMGGLIGSFRVDSDGLAPFWPYLWLGQWTHVGRGCTMGLGGYTLDFTE